MGIFLENQNNSVSDKMSLLTVAKYAGVSLSKIGAPAMSSAANSFKQTLLNVPSTEVSIYLLSLSVCLYVCMHRINVKTSEQIGRKVCVDLTRPQGRFMNDQNSKNSLQQNLTFIKIFKSTTFFYKIRELFCLFFVFYVTKRKFHNLITT